MGALIALAGSVLAGLAGRGLARRAVPLVAGAVGGGLLGSELGGGGPFPGFFGLGAGAADAGPKRRRRRKALTNTDISTALTIASAISKKAAENFILVRARGS